MAGKDYSCWRDIIKFSELTWNLQRWGVYSIRKEGSDSGKWQDVKRNPSNKHHLQPFRIMMSCVKNDHNFRFISELISAFVLLSRLWMFYFCLVEWKQFYGFFFPRTSSHFSWIEMSMIAHSIPVKILPTFVRYYGFNIGDAHFGMPYPHLLIIAWIHHVIAPVILS